jgi:competence protein ComEC
VSEPRLALPLDFRLAIGAGAAWIVLACSQNVAPSTAILFAVAATACGGFAVLFRLGWGRVIALCGVCVAIVLVPFAARQARARDSPLEQLAALRTSVTVELVLEADPHALAASGPSGVARVAVEASAIAVEVRGIRTATTGDVLVLGMEYQWRGLLPGQRVLADGTLQPSFDSGSTEVVLSSTVAPVLLGRPPWWQRAAGDVRSSLQAASSVLPSEERGLLPGLIDGDTSRLDPVLADRFRIAGLTHLVAVSGTNCSILVGFVVLLLRRCRVRPVFCAGAGLLVLIAFVVVARGSPSVLRAAIMAVIAMVSLATGRPRQAMPAVAAAVLVLLVWDPTLAVNVGFAMSVLATGALVSLAPVWAGWLRAHHVPPGVAEALAIAAAADVVTAPIVAAISGRISVVAIPANILAEPVVAVVTVVGFLAAAVAPLWLVGGQALAWVAGWPCRWLVLVAERAGGAPGAALPWPNGFDGAVLMVLAMAGFALALRRSGPLRWIAGIALIASFVQMPIRLIAPGWPPPGWLMVACDVGQGDGIVLNAGPHVAVEVDTGPDPLAMDRCLRDLGITRIALLVITHFHLDHVAGIAGALHGRQLGQVWVGPLDEPKEGLELVSQALGGRHARALLATPGSTATVGAVHLEVLGPASAFHGTRSDPNNSSLVIRATMRGVRILLAGDAEIESEQALLDEGVDLRADVLKVPHHGSAYFVPGFLAAVHARVAVISVGLHNDYGQPAPSLLHELARLNVPVLRTDRVGDVAIVDSGVGPAGLATVTHEPSRATALGPRESAANLAGEGHTRTASEGDARIGTCPGPSALISFRTRCRRLWSLSAMKSFLSPEASARSPPGYARSRPSC